MRDRLDVIVPVYRGFEETRTCLESVLAARVRHPVEVVVIDDAGPDASLRDWLARQAAAKRFTLLANPANAGFVASANRGMALHPDHDVLLLNADTEVAHDWIDRIVAHAARDPSIGTVTPFSTNATICSYPRTLQSNPLPEGETTATLDDDCARANAGICVDIPTAVGFCMLITRDCLDAVGMFDEARYGTGYGEEVDFCMRAARGGFRHVLAADVFVRHVGEVSFGDVGAARRAKAQATVDALYPEFQEKLRAFIPEDPAREARRRVDLQRVAHVKPPLSLGDEGARTAAGVLRLTPVSPTTAQLRWDRDGEEMTLWPPIAREVLAPLALALRRHDAMQLDPGWLRPPQAEGFADAAARADARERLAACIADELPARPSGWRRLAELFRGSSR